MTSAACAGYMSLRHCASSPDASSPRTRSSSRAIDPAQKPILSHRQKLSQTNKNPRLTAGGFYWGHAPAAGVTPHCAGAASPRRGHSEPESPSPPTASMKFSGAALFAAYGPAMSCTARSFLPGACPLPRSAAGYFPPTQKGPAQRRGLLLFRQEPDQLRFCRQSMVKG